MGTYHAGSGSLNNPGKCEVVIILTIGWEIYNFLTSCMLYFKTTRKWTTTTKKNHPQYKRMQILAPFVWNDISLGICDNGVLHVSRHWKLGSILGRMYTLHYDFTTDNQQERVPLQNYCQMVLFQTKHAVFRWQELHTGLLNMLPIIAAIHSSVAAFKSKQLKHRDKVLCISNEAFHNETMALLSYDVYIYSWCN